MADHRETWLDTIARHFRSGATDVERIEATFNLSRGRGEAERKLNVDPAPLLEGLEPGETEANRRRIGGWVQGILHALQEPATSEADTWAFKRAAGSIYPKLVSEAFVDGAGHATQTPLWTRPFVDDLHFVYIIELDGGIRLLTSGQFEDWSATEDRVTSAGRSLLFHKSRSASPALVEDSEPVEALAVGDGYDAARITVLKDLLFGEFDAGSRVAIPDSDSLLFVRDGTDHAVDALRTACETQFEHGSIPLTRRLFRFERSNVVPADA